MALTTYADGSQTATVTTEHFLSSPNAVGTYQLQVDTNAMAAGDVLELRVYVMTRASGAQRVAYFDAWSGAQPAHDQIKISVPITNTLTDTNALRFSLTQTFGTGRAFPWKLWQSA